MSLQQAPQAQYSIPDRDKQLLFSEFEDLSASFRSLYKTVFEQSYNQQSEFYTWTIPSDGLGKNVGQVQMEILCAAYRAWEYFTLTGGWKHCWIIENN